MKEEKKYYTEAEVDIKKRLVEETLKDLDTCSMKDLKDHYKYFLKEPLFFKNYMPYDEEILNGTNDEEALKSYFRLGLNVLRTNLNNYDFLKTIDILEAKDE